MNNGIDPREINEAVRRLKELPGYIDRDVKALVKHAAEPVLRSAKTKAPKSEKPHYRYKNGNKVAYYPGNLKRAIVFLPFKKSKSVWIGPALGKGIGKVDGYYAHFVEFGTRHSSAVPYMRPAFDNNQNIVVSRLEMAVRRHIKPWETRYQRR